MHLKVTHLHGGRAGGVEYFDNGPVMIGRDPASDLRLDTDDDTVASGRHAEISVDSGAFWLADVGSTNGTFVAGEPITRHRLRDGDIVEFGRGGPQVRFTIEPGEAPVADVPGTETRIAAAITEERQRTIWGVSGLGVALLVAIVVLAWVGRGRLVGLGDEIDATNAAMQQAARQLETQVDTLRSDLEVADRELERDVATVQGDLARSRQELDGRIGVLAAQVDVAEAELSRVGALAEQNKESLLEGLRSIEDRMRATDSRVVALEAAADQTGARLDDLNARLASARSDLQALEAQQGQDVAALSTSIQEQAGKVAAIDGVARAAQARAGELRDEVDAARTRFAELQDRYYQLSHRVHSIEEGADPRADVVRESTESVPPAGSMRSSDSRANPVTPVPPDGARFDSNDPGADSVTPRGGDAGGSRLLTAGVRISASTAQASNPAAFAIDGDLSTYWLSETDVRPWIELTLDRPYVIEAIEIAVAPSRAMFLEWARLSEALFEFPDGSGPRCRLEDSPGLQSCPIPELTARSFRIKWAGLIEGRADAIQVLTEIRVVGRPAQ